MSRSSRAASQLFVLAVAAAGTFAAPDARAESAPAPPRCDVKLHPEGSGVPANLPAFVIDKSRSSAGLSPVVTVTKITGGTTAPVLGQIADPHTPGVALLVPSTNDLLEAGSSYTIEYTATCGGPTGTGSVSFQAGPAVALPTKMGTAAPRAAGGADLTPSVELAAFLRTTRFEAIVDGVSWGPSNYAIGASKTPIHIDVRRTSVTIGSATVYSATDVCKAATPAERHEIKIVAHVAGADADTEALAFSTDIDCSAKVPIGSSSGGTGGTLPDGGGDDRGASGGSDDGGCSTSGSAPLGRLAGIFLAGAGVATLLRRRRSSRAAR